MTFADFLFVNQFIPAAFFVAGFACIFKFQFQALCYMLAVIYACDTFPQFAFLTTVLIIQCTLSASVSAARSER